MHRNVTLHHSFLETKMGERCKAKDKKGNKSTRKIKRKSWQQQQQQQKKKRHTEKRPDAVPKQRMSCFFSSNEQSEPRTNTATYKLY